MSKRKAAVNDIIYELDNDDVEFSSEDEGKSSKISRLETQGTSENVLIRVANQGSSVEIIDCSLETDCVIDSPNKVQNGGKPLPEVMLVEHEETAENPETLQEPCTVMNETNVQINHDKTLNEDIVIDSPHSDLGVVGCENRTPLVTVRFKDQKFAKLYKERVKEFMLSLLKLNDEDSSTGSETETDLELDVWPEDLVDEDVTKEVGFKSVEDHVEVGFKSVENHAEVVFKGVENHVDVSFKGVENSVKVSVKAEEPVDTQPEDSLFFVDTDPGAEGPHEIPRYSQNTTVMANAAVKQLKQLTPPLMRRGPSCFNCDGAHNLRECRLPRNNMKIAQKRQAMTSTRVGRYHVEDEQKYGHLVAGRISGRLRNALGLKRHELPRHVYRMRLLGYPPGWLEEARISHSGITMFDSTGKAIQDPDEEEGEVCEPGSKDKFDIKKILDIPGFNVPASSRYQDESHLFGLPPMSEQDSKLAMLQMLAPNAMKAYKRKKLAFFPSADKGGPAIVGQAEMELDSGDELVEFPSVPPLPDEAPPPPPPPPPPPLPPQPPAEEPDDVEVIEVMKVPDIPVPEDTWITIDEDDSEDEKSQESQERSSPTLDDLEEKKRKLLDALQGDDFDASALVELTELAEIEDAKTASDSTKTTLHINSDDSINDFKKTTTDSKSSTKAQKPKVTQKTETCKEIDTNKLSKVQITDDAVLENDSSAKRKIKQESESIIENPDSPLIDKEKPEMTTPKTIDKSSENSACSSKSTAKSEKTDTLQKLETPQKAGHVKTTAYGTPVMNIASPFTKLPTDDKFAKDICDVINFENLPNSTGKYKQISKLLKKVKTKVDKIQES